jgi:hypothetical protein
MAALTTVHHINCGRIVARRRDHGDVVQMFGANDSSELSGPMPDTTTRPHGAQARERAVGDNAPRPWMTIACRGASECSDDEHQSLLVPVIFRG